MDLVVELVDLVAELVMLMLLVLVLLPLLVVELMKHKSSSHPSLRLVAGKVGAGASWRLCGSL